MNLRQAVLAPSSAGLTYGRFTWQATQGQSPSQLVSEGDTSRRLLFTTLRCPGGLLWLTASFAPVEHPADMVVVLRLGDRLGAIAAPTLVIAVDRDRIYSPELVAHTVERIRQAL
jgi:hypothetical protein